MQYGELIDFLQNVGKDPSRLLFEDELTGLHNRRFLLSFLQHKVNWNQDEHFPLSLLLTDVDLLKSINDTYGRDAGDQALVFVAGLVKEIAGQDGFAIRFAGDEFMLLLPRMELTRAVQQAHRLHQLAQERPLVLSGGKDELRISLSIGVASARMDATSGNDLIRKADTALYASKKLGRNRVSVAKETDPEKTALKAALHRLELAEVSGRNGELAAVSEALGALTLGKSRFLVIEGAAGMGKSTVIETVRRSLERNPALSVVKIAGRGEERFRPYYLAGKAILSWMSQRADKGIPALDALDARELHYLGHVLPRFDDRSPALEEDEPRRRQGIFATLVKLTLNLAEGKPIVVLVDDLHFADEGSLALLRVLFTRADFKILVCGAVVASDEEALPWRRFLASRSSELGIETRKLQPLTSEDIRKHLADVFPGIDVPPGLEDELARISSGSPLFLVEILRKLVLDRKLILSGQRWTVEPTEGEYLPRSLEEIVTQKIAALDPQGRSLLEHASTLGEEVPLSILAGASHTPENEVLEFLDRARDLGLLRTDFRINDETMRFLSKRVLEIVNGSIHDGRRKELHERVGSYQEDLHARRLGPSVSILAYHFERSANQEKRSRYGELHREIERRTFDLAEAERYTEETLVEGGEGSREEKLSAEALAQLPSVFRTLVTTVRSVQFYPPDSTTIQTACLSAFDAVAAMLDRADRVALSCSQGALLANGQKVDVSEFRLLASAYLELLDRAELESIEFRKGLSPAELGALLTHLGRELKPGSLAVDEGLPHIHLRQRKLETDPEKASDAELGSARVVRAFLGAAKTAKLYPFESRQVGAAVDLFLEELLALLARRPELTLARAEGALLIDGAQVPGTGFEDLAENVVNLLSVSQLESVTFLPRLTREELLGFLAALKEPAPVRDPSFWQRFAREKELHGLAFDSTGRATEDGDEPLEALIEGLPRIAKDLLVKGEHQLVRKLIHRLFVDYRSQDVVTRERIVRSCRALLDALVQALQYRFGALAADDLLEAFREERDDHVLGELANLLYQMSGNILQFADFGLASRVFAELQDRQRELMKTPRATERGLAVLSRKLDASTRTLLMEELQSKVPERQEQAALVLESLGKPAISLLVEVIKQEKDFRTRQLAAGLLSRMGRDAAERIKQEVVLEVTSEQRFRILEVIDVVARDLKTELAFCLSDIHPKVRRAAFRLSERLNGKQVLELLVDFARHPDISVARGAIRSLANLRSPHAVGALISTLEVTKDPERAIACAQALAQLGDAVAVPALEEVLTARRYPVLGGLRWDDQVRATAAFALAHIGGDRARAALEKVAEDPDPRIRQIAAHGIAGSPAIVTEPEPDEVGGTPDEDEGVA